MSAQSISGSPPPAAKNQPITPRVSVQEYLARERQSDVRHEYVEGIIVAMSGETPAHNQIAGNIYVAFELAFADRPCRSFFEGIRVRTSPTRYRYPDVAALCDTAQFDRDNPPALLNPSVIVEVLSPSTEEFDREEKFIEYRQLESLTDYVLVFQDQVQAVHYIRQSDRQWLVTILDSPTAALSFMSLNVSLTLADVYRKVVFAPSEPSGGAETHP